MQMPILENAAGNGYIAVTTCGGSSWRAWAFRLPVLMVVSRRPISRPLWRASRSNLRGDADFLITNKLSGPVTSTSALTRNALSWLEQNR